MVGEEASAVVGEEAAGEEAAEEEVTTVEVTTVEVVEERKVAVELAVRRRATASAMPLALALHWASE